jgi:hypothetical protein
MESKDIPSNAFAKDTEYIKSRLRRRQKMTFQKGVELSAPADKLHELVAIQSADAEETIIMIHSTLESQE